MRISLQAASCVLLMIFASIMIGASDTRAEVGINVGDYWNYELMSSRQGLRASGTLGNEVTGTDGSGLNEVFIVATHASGNYSGTDGGKEVSGSAVWSGVAKRLKSNFSLLSHIDNEHWLMNYEGMPPYDSVLNLTETASPPIDDYILNHNPGLGGSTKSDSLLTITVFVGHAIGNNPQTFVTWSNLTMTISPTMEKVSTPAGVFDCYNVTEVTTDPNSSSPVMTTFYYSDDVGNFVKEVAPGGLDSLPVYITELELKSYSYQGRHGGTQGGVMSMFTGKNLWITALIVIAAAIVLVLALLHVRRGHSERPPIIPAQQGK